MLVNTNNPLNIEVYMKYVIASQKCEISSFSTFNQIDTLERKRIVFIILSVVIELRKH